jgi:hypothetical protein
MISMDVHVEVGDFFVNNEESLCKCI